MVIVSKIYAICVDTVFFLTWRRTHFIVNFLIYQDREKNLHN